MKTPQGIFRRLLPAGSLVLAHNSVAYLDIWFALGRIGAILQNLNWRLTSYELEGLIANAEPIALIYSAGFGETVNSRGLRMLLSLRAVPGTGWIIGAQQPASEALAPIREARLRILWGIVISAAAAVLLGAALIRRLTRLLEQLVHDQVVVSHHGVDKADGGADFGDVLPAPGQSDRIFDAAFDRHDFEKRVVQQPLQLAIDQRMQVPESVGFHEVGVVAGEDEVGVVFQKEVGDVVQVHQAIQRR